MKKISLLVIVFLALFTGCQKKEKELVKPDSSTSEVPSLVVSLDSLFSASSAQVQAAAAAFGAVQFTDKFKYGISVYKLNYRSNYKDSPIIASGLIYFPIGTTTAAPILSVQHGTTFVKAEAPSVQKGLTGMEFFASAGYITLMPDFIGYGASASIDHPYYDAKHSALAVSDMIRAAKEYLDKSKRLSYNSKVFLTGYSEGGYVTLAAQKGLEENPVQGLNVTAVAAGAGGYDLADMLQNIASSNYYSYPAYLTFIIKSYNEVYNWQKPSAYFYNKNFAGKIDTLLNGTNEGDYINTQLTTNMDSLLQADFYQSLKGNGANDFKNALVLNSLTNWKPLAPLRLYHGTEDEVINYQNSVSTYNKLKSNGATVELIPLDGQSHETGLKPMILSAFTWIESFN